MLPHGSDTVYTSHVSEVPAADHVGAGFYAAQKTWIPRFTKAGFKKTRAPPLLFALLKVLTGSLAALENVIGSENTLSMSKCHSLLRCKIHKHHLKQQTT